MKRTLLATAIGLTFIGASAQLCAAQSYGNGGGGDAAQNAQMPDQAQPADDQNGWSGHYWRHAHRGYSDDNGMRGPRGAEMRAEGGPPWGPPPFPHHPPPPPPPPPGNAAHFVFQHGDARIDITCPQYFALRDCIGAATELLDEIHSLRGSAGHPGAQGGPAGGGGPAAAPSGGAGTNGPQSTPGNGATPPAASPETGGNNKM